MKLSKETINKLDKSKENVDNLIKEAKNFIAKNRLEGWHWCKDKKDWAPHYYDPKYGWAKDAECGFYYEDYDFDEIDERLAEPPKMSEMQIFNIYKNMDKLIKSKNDKNKEILKLQAEDVLCQMLIGLGHKKLVLDYNKIF